MAAGLPIPSFLLFFLLLFLQLVSGQTQINGQTFTNGLSIISSPLANNPAHAGSPISIAVDVSGDGKLQSPSTINSLQIYLVSDETNLNMTVTADPSFLTSQPGSTVKHLDWPVPPCLPAGNYNLTFYETSSFNQTPVFAITPILVPLSNPNPSGNCSSPNPLQSQPQPANPLPQPPFAPSSSVSASPASVFSSLPTSSGMVTKFTSGTSADLETLTIVLSNGVLELPTVTVISQVSATPTTVVLISMATVTDIVQGTPTT
ncbi:hypothetical protein FB45DRAFT_916439 [Roridomyces roridus]|uniref:Uncharacterized protein n=1 Tax=Roridomyces roridus TaxID=1738132 RepID=A0AAD7BTZ5_9AGAR|nr:hypothetical protein FB45DRAFT_916439 [Roridomyces roridus]